MVKQTTVGALPKRQRFLAYAATLSLSLVMSAGANAQQGDAERILKSMADYVTGQRTISATIDTSIEVVSADLQKIQFTSSGQVTLSRPDKLRMSRVGGYANAEMFFDGKMVTLLERDRNAFMQADAPGSVDQLVERLRNELEVEVPGADLLLSNVYDQLIEGVYDAKHIGLGVIDGVECEHLAFRTADADWQLWIEVGARPIPRQYVITSKTLTAAPQYTLRVRTWQTDVTVTADTFAFQPPPNAKKVDRRELVDIDEVPPGVVVGEKK
jgi:hypothetical protein